MTLHNHIDTFLHNTTHTEQSDVGPPQIIDTLTASLAPPAVEEPMDLLPCSPRTPKMTLCGFGFESEESCRIMPLKTTAARSACFHDQTADEQMKQQQQQREPLRFISLSSIMV